jgi:succinate-acetate transporter protein
MGLAVFVGLFLLGKLEAKDLAPSLGWILLSFAIFNTYMMLWSTRINVAVFAVFLTLEVTEILLFIGNFAGSAAGTGLILVGGWVGILTALTAFYASAAGVINGMAPSPVLPVGGPLWGAAPEAAAVAMPRAEA